MHREHLGTSLCQHALTGITVVLYTHTTVAIYSLHPITHNTLLA
jgi:hypothetical protein